MVDSRAAPQGDSVQTGAIVLLQPRAEPDWPDPGKVQGLPLALLTLAAPLVQEGFDVRLFDQNVSPRLDHELQTLEEPPLLVGLSVIGGHTLLEAMRLARKLRQRWPQTPLVWGGWNPTLMQHLYEAPSRNPWIDAIVAGRGEIPLLNIAKQLQKRGSLGQVPGIAWRKPNGEFEHTPPTPAVAKAAKRPRTPYHLIPEMNQYITRHGVINYISSHGCPHRCTFCGIPVGTRTFKPLDLDAVIEDLTELRAMDMKTIVFLDDNFFTVKARVLSLAQRLIDEDLDLQWGSNGRIDQVLALSESELSMLKESGAQAINIGYETGSQKVADLAKKDVQVDRIYEVADRFQRVGLCLSINVMVGLPGETPSDLVESLESLKFIYHRQPDMEVCWYMFMPAPGTAAWKQLVKQGILTEPASLEEHTRFQSLYLEHPWFYESPPKAVFREWRSKHKAIAWYFFVAYVAERPGGKLRGALFDRKRNWCRWRYESREFRYRFDWRLAFEVERLRVRLRWVTAAFSRTNAARFIARKLGWTRQPPSRGSYILTGAHRGT